MPPPSIHAVSLTPHPEAPAGALRSIAVRVRRSSEGVVSLRYTLEGDLARVRVAERVSSGVGDRLWQHTCCEAFIRLNGALAYHELNFAPSGAWAAYVFERYRERTTSIDRALDPDITVRACAERLELDASIRLARLSPVHVGARLSLALSAVVEDLDGRVSYWALAHPPGKPDFHHPDAFALALAPLA